MDWMIPGDHIHPHDFSTGTIQFYRTHLGSQVTCHRSPSRSWVEFITIVLNLSELEVIPVPF